VDRTLGGKEFQARAAATGNARSPTVDRRVDGTTSVDVLTDLSRQQVSTSVYTKHFLVTEGDCQKPAWLPQ